MSQYRQRQNADKKTRDEKKAQEQEERKKLQSQGYGFSHNVPARGIPRDITDMATHMSPYGGRRGQVTEQGLKAIRRRMREARI